MFRMARALLVSTYDLGHQPFGLASPAAWLKREGLEVECTDLPRQKLEEDALRRADLIAFHLPMHTATRMAAPIIRKARALNAASRICVYGLYAPLNDGWLRSLGVDDVLDGEFEGKLASIGRQIIGRTADANSTPDAQTHSPSLVSPAKLRFIAPDRSGLPALNRYATLQMPDGTRRVTGYTEASRGCRHLCRHCPIVPVY